MNMYRVTWETDIEGASPRDAAQAVWSEVWGFDPPGPDDGCVFLVEGPEGTIVVDLAESEDND